MSTVAAADDSERRVADALRARATGAGRRPQVAASDDPEPRISARIALLLALLAGVVLGVALALLSLLVPGLLPPLG